MSADSVKTLRHAVPTLVYHDIADGAAARAFRRYVVPPALLDEHLSALHSAGYKTLPASAATHPVGATIPISPTVVLTFDDAYASFANSVMPLMSRYNMISSVFVPTAHVGRTAAWLADIGEEGRQLMTWQDLTDCCAAGAEVGAHGHCHLPFDLISKQKLISEIADSRAILEDRLGRSVATLAYPYGFHSRRVRRQAKASGFASAFEVGDNLQPSLGSRPRDDRLFRLRRIVVDPSFSGDDLLSVIRDGTRSPTVQRLRCMVRPGRRVVRRLSSAQLSASWRRDATT